jgi:hypothetical protein
MISFLADFNTYPVRVERVALHWMGVTHAVCFGMPSDIWKQRCAHRSICIRKTTLAIGMIDDRLSKLSRKAARIA